MKTIPHDKANHIAAGAYAALLGVLAGAWLPGLHLLPFGAPGHALLACGLAAVAREHYNQVKGAPFDWQDILATLAGGLPVAAALAVA